MKKDLKPKDIKNELQKLGWDIKEYEDKLDIFEFFIWYENSVKGRFPDVFDYLSEEEEKVLDNTMYFVFNRAANAGIGGVNFLTLYKNKPTKEFLMNDVLVSDSQEELEAMVEKIIKQKPFCVITIMDVFSKRNNGRKRKDVNDYMVDNVCLVQTPYWILMIHTPIDSNKKRPRFTTQTLKNSTVVDVLKPDDVLTAFNVSSLLNTDGYKKLII